MNYNDTQFAELSRFEENFRTATSTPTGWTRRIAIPDQRRIKAIYTEATGERIPYTIGCGNCLLSLLKKAGKLYFADKVERENPAPPTPSATEKPETASPTPKKAATKPAKTAEKKSTTRKPKAAKIVS